MLFRSEMLFESTSTSITFVLTVLATSPYPQCMVNEDARKVCGQDNDIQNVVPIRGFLKMAINRRQELKSGHHCSEPGRTLPCTPRLCHTAWPVCETLLTLAAFLSSLQDRGAAEPSFLFQVTSPPGPPWSVLSVGTPGGCCRPFLNPSMLSVKVLGAPMSCFASLPCVP